MSDPKTPAQFEHEDEYVFNMLAKLPKGQRDKFLAQLRAASDKANAKAQKVVHDKHPTSSNHQAGKGPGTSDAGVKRYVGFIHVKLMIRDKDNKSAQWIPKTLDVPYSGESMPTASEVDLLVDEEIQFVFDNSPIIDIQRVPDGVEVAIHKIDYAAPKPAERAAKDFVPLPYSGFNTAYDTKRRRCGIDFVKAMQGEDNKKLCSNDYNIVAVMTGAMGTKGEEGWQKPTHANFERAYNENKDEVDRIIADGVTALHVKHVAMYLGVSMAALDEDDQVVMAYAPPVGQQKAHRRACSSPSAMATCRRTRTRPSSEESPRACALPRSTLKSWEVPI